MFMSNPSADPLRDMPVNARGAALAVPRGQVLAELGQWNGFTQAECV